MMRTKTRFFKGVTYDEKGAVVDCIFCSIINRTAPGTIVKEDDDFIAFRTIKPVTSAHFLICPKKHIQNLSAMHSAEDVALLRRLHAFGKECLQEASVATEDSIHCFHIPPFNSIDHLHLHSIGNAAERSYHSMLKYTPGYFPWCKSIESVVKAMEGKLRQSTAS